jgi:hypothetical protein
MPIGIIITGGGDIPFVKKIPGGEAQSSIRTSKEHPAYITIRRGGKEWSS